MKFTELLINRVTLGTILLPFFFFFPAVFVAGENIVPAYSLLLGLYQCSQAIKTRVTVHTVFPASHPPQFNDLRSYHKQAAHQKLHCEELLAEISRKENPIRGKWNYANVKVITSIL